MMSWSNPNGLRPSVGPPTLEPLLLSVLSAVWLENIGHENTAKCQLELWKGDSTSNAKKHI